MANNNLLTQFAKVIQSELMYYYPVITYPLNPNINLSSMYCFLGKVDPWDNDDNPPAPLQDQKSIKNIFKNMFVIKQIQSGDISPVIARIDWQQGITYDYYSDDINMLDVNPDGTPVYTFYVKNSYDQVYKCLWNNNDSPSLVEPIFQPGTYGTNNIFQSYDGYKWKYMFTVDLGLKTKFMDNTWIPLPAGVFAIGAEEEEQNIGSGDIEVINVTNGGTGYDPANSQIFVTITGDGTGASGTAVVDKANGIITDIIVTNTGTNYTYANVHITTANSLIGSGATAIAPVSPIGGHASDPTSELGAVHDMFVCSFTGTENGVIPGDVNNNITYYQVGLLVDPSDYASQPNPANGQIYQLTTNLFVAPGYGEYAFEEVVYQGSPDSPTFTGTVLHFNVDTNVVYLINTYGNPLTSIPLYSYTSGTTRTLLSFNKSNIVPYTGYINYVENRSGVQRSTDGIEQFKFVLGY
jgi:hypothetical protein